MGLIGHKFYAWVMGLIGPQEMGLGPQVRQVDGHLWASGLNIRRGGPPT